MISARGVARAAVVAAVVVLAVGGAAFGQTHAPWPADWNNWSDPALWVPVGNPGNAADNTGYGAVAYPFNMGKFEVTAGQYTAFLNAVAATDTYGLYNTNMDTAVYSYGCNIKRAGSSGNYTYSVASDWANRPVDILSWGDSARFANWLTNGQPTGTQGLTTTENGSYYLNGAISDAALLAVVRKSPQQGARYYIPTEDEWYKAAYHKNDGRTGNYFDYPTGSDSVPTPILITPDPGNNANFYQGGYMIGSPYYRTVVGDFENSKSPYGTFDQGGNVWEWNEAILYDGSCRSLRGGAFGSDFVYGGDFLRASDRSGNIPSLEWVKHGFRVSEVPEPQPLPRTHVLCVGVNWGWSFLGDKLRGDSDATALSQALQGTLASSNVLQPLVFDPSVSDGSNLGRFREEFQSLADRIMPGDTLILSFATHGDSYRDGPEPPFNTNLWASLPYGWGPMELRTGDEHLELSATGLDDLFDDALRDLLAVDNLSQVNKIVILDACRSGGFGPDLTASISNIAVLAACNEGYFAFSDLFGRGLFTNSIIDALRTGPLGYPWADWYLGNRDGIVSLDELEAFIRSWDFGDLLGQELPLRRVEGTGIFGGLEFEFTASADFTGGFVGTPEPATLALLSLGGLGMLVRRRRK